MIWILTLFLLLVAACHASAAPSIRIGAISHVSADWADVPHVEPHLGVDPADPSRLVVAAMMLRPEGLGVAAYASHDGGRSWTSQQLPNCAFDPWVEFATTGTGYVSCLAGDDALVFATTDAGHSWSAPIRIEGGAEGELDHTSLAASEEGSELVIVGLQNATQDGKTYVVPFVSPIPLDESISPFRTRLIWNDLWANTLNAAWIGSTLLVAYADFMIPGRGHPQTLRFWCARSFDGGHTFRPPSLLTEVHESSTIPVLARGGPSGAAYVAFDDVRDGRSGVWLVRSEDAGETWTLPLPVATVKSGSKRHFNAQVAADAHGQILVAWYETAHQDRCFQVFVAASSDAGGSFSPPLPLREHAFCVDTEGNSGAEHRWPYGGDYFGLAALSQDRFFVVWSDSSTGMFQVWGAAVDIVDH
jgi:hypothetical protein